MGDFYTFGPFELHPDGGLHKNGTAVPIPPKEHAMLELLVRRAGQVVSHEVIYTEIWPRQHVSYISVSRCVYSLRRILGGKRSEYVETVSKRGYRFVKAASRHRMESRSFPWLDAITVSPLALSHFMEGLAHANRPTPRDQERAVALFEEANRVEGRFPAALGAIAECRMYQSIWGYVPPEDARRLIAAACKVALQADGPPVTALCVKGWAQGVLDCNFDAGLRTIDLVIKKNAGHAKAHVFRSWILRAAGRVEDCVASARDALHIDPHSHLIRHVHAWGVFCLGRAEEALRIEMQILRDRPDDYLARTYTGLFLAYLGHHQEAVIACRRAYTNSDENPAVATALTYAVARAGEHREARSLAAEALKCTAPATLRPHLAMTFVSLGDFETAIRLLLEARRSGCPWASAALIDPRLGPLAGDSRLACLRDRRRPGLPF